MVAEPNEWAVDLERIDEPIEQMLERVANDRRRLVVRRGGKPLVVIEPARAAPTASPEDFALLREVSELFADVPLDELNRQVDAAVAEVRRQRRERQAS